MDDKTLTALQQSIAKWERNAVAPLRSLRLGPDSCPLCVRFYDNYCIGCPVSKAGYHGCGRTPYDDADFAHDDWLSHPRSKQCREAFHAAARAEVDFLKSLLPESAR